MVGTERQLLCACTHGDLSTVMYVVRSSSCFRFFQVTAEGEPDEVVERATSDAVKLYQITDESGTMVSTQVEGPDGKLTGDMLEV